MQKYMNEARQLLALAIPVIISAGGPDRNGICGYGDGRWLQRHRYGRRGNRNLYLASAILFGHGLLLALTPVIAQLNGSGRRERIAHQVRQGFWLAGFVSVLIMIVLWNAGHIIRAMHNIGPALADKAVGYLRPLLWGVPGYLLRWRVTSAKVCKTKPGMVMGFIGFTGQHSGELYLYLRPFWHAGAWRRRLRRGNSGGILGDVLCAYLPLLNTPAPA